MTSQQRLTRYFTGRHHIRGHLFLNENSVVRCGMVIFPAFWYVRDMGVGGDKPFSYERFVRMTRHNGAQTVFHDDITGAGVDFEPGLCPVYPTPQNPKESRV